MNLRKLAAIAEASSQGRRAERLYRESLAIAIEVENGLDIAESQEELGRFLLEQQARSEEGCSMLQEALETYRTMKVPGEQRVKGLMQRLGCDGENA